MTPGGLLALISAAVATLVVLLVLARRGHERTRREWAEFRGTVPDSVIAAVQLEVDVSRYVTQSSLEAITEARALGDLGRAKEMLDHRLSMVEQDTPGRLRRVAAMAKAARMVAALVVPPPVDYRRFRLRSIATVAGVGGLCDRVMVGAPERFALRMAVLSYGFRAALRTALRSRAGIRRAQMREEARERLWALAEASFLDWGTVDEEHLASYKALFGPRP